MEYITNVSQAQWLLTEPEFVVDIETDTDSPITGWKEWGLSHNADITWVSFFVGGHAPVVFNMDRSLPEYTDIVQFIRNVFNRTGYTVVGHNLVFDLRNILSHYQCHIPLGSLAWDTLTMSVLLLMGDNVKDGISLKALAHKYRLHSSQEELEFSEMMKASRATLHTVDEEKVLRYVALDTEMTWRLFELQKKVIETTGFPTIEPIPVTSDGLVTIITRDVGNGRNMFSSTKHWSKLQELVHWEQRISRWCGNQAARGIRLDREHLARHREKLTTEYADAFDQLNEHIEQTIGIKNLIKLSHLIRWDETLTYYSSIKRRRKPDHSKWIYAKMDNITDEEFNSLKRYIVSDNVDGWFDFLMDERREHPEGHDVESNINFKAFVQTEIITWEDDQEWCDVRTDYFLKFFIPYFKSKKPFLPKKLTSTDVFQMMYMFVIKQFSFPTNEEILSNSDLVTPALQEFVAAGAELDYQREAIYKYGWSISGDSLKHYFRDEDGEQVDDPFRTIVDHRTKINRVEEFERHAMRDGRIHSVIARKTQTGRATSTTMNLQNIQMKDFKGYLVPDSDDRMFISIDISNAENWLLAMTFGDSELAKACSGGDFHMQMTKIYWPELSAKLISEERWDELSALRKKSKFVTFGSAYGAGAKKIAKMIGTTEEEAKRLLANRDARFLNYSQGRGKLQTAIEKTYKDGYRPAFTTLWSGRRIAIPLEYRKKTRMVDDKIVTEGKWELPAYKAINYLPQGGVGEIIWRSIVITSEDMEREGRDVYVSSQVHDELVVDVRPDDAFEVAQRIIQTIATIIPDAALDRTLPKTRMLSEVGPENRKKWGYRGTENWVYPLPLDKFVNRWGVHDMPEGEDEAPTWVCDYSIGDTIEGEIEAFRKKYEQNYIDVKDPIPKLEMDGSNQWKQLDVAFSNMWKALEGLNEHRSLQQIVLDGKNFGLYDFPNRMLIMQDAAHKGQPAGEEYELIWKKVQQIKSEADQLLKWYEQYKLKEDNNVGSNS